MPRQKGYTLKELCNALKVSIIGFRAWVCGGSAERKRLTDAQMLSCQQHADQAPDAAERYPRPPQAPLPVHELVAPNLLDRHFRPSPPNQVWNSDITYLWTNEGWLYLAIVLNLFNREVIRWSIKPLMISEVVTDALTKIGFRCRPTPGLIIIPTVAVKMPAKPFNEQTLHLQHDLLDKSQRQLLGQCPDRELVQQLQE